MLSLCAVVLQGTHTKNVNVGCSNTVATQTTCWLQGTACSGAFNATGLQILENGYPLGVHILK